MKIMDTMRLFYFNKYHHCAIRFGDEIAQYTQRLYKGEALIGCELFSKGCSVEPSALYFLRADCELGSFHTSKVKLWDEQKDSRGAVMPRNDLTLHGDVGEQAVIITLASSLFEQPDGFLQMHSVLQSPLEVMASFTHEVDDILYFDAMVIFQVR